MTTTTTNVTTTDLLRDIMNNCHSLGMLESLKVTTKDGATLVQSIDDMNTVVVNAKLTSVLSNFPDGTVGFSRLGVLDGYIKQYNTTETKITVALRDNPDSAQTATDIQFNDGTSKSNYRLSSKAMIDGELRIPTFGGADWVVDFEPTSASIRKLQSMSSIHNSESAVGISTKNRCVVFTIGGRGQDGTVMKFHTGLPVGMEMTSEWKWPISTVLSILKLHNTSVSTRIKISNVGALVFEIESAYGTYEYILSALTG